MTRKRKVSIGILLGSDNRPYRYGPGPIEHFLHYRIHPEL